MGATNLPTVKVEMGFTAATGTYFLWDSGLWDTATWGPDLTWSDVTKYVLGFRTSFGRQRETDRFAAGTGQIVLDNIDGRFTPDNPNSPYVSGGVTGIRPWRPCRISATWNGITYAVAYMFALSWNDSYPAVNRAITTVPLIDGMGILGGHNGTAGRALVGGSESSGTRIQRLLNDANWTLTRQVDVGNSTCQPTNLSSNTLSEIQLTAESEGGAFWQDPDGTMIFERGYALIENTRSNTSQATFGDNNGETNYEDIQFDYSGDLVWNVANFQRSGGAVQTNVDNTSRALYGDRVYNSSTLVCESDALANALSQFYIIRYASPDKRVQSVSFHPSANTAIWAQCLGRRIRDRVTVNRRQPTSGTPWTTSRSCFIDGISHAFDSQSNDWKTTFYLSSADAWTQTTARWDTATWDSATFFY